MNADIVLTARQARAAADGQLALARVLVVDDSGSDQRLITEMLVEAGATREHLQRASTLAEARRSLSEHPATCILLDLSLPDATGLEGVAVLSAAVPDTPIVVITGHPADWLVYAAMAEGADEYLCKAELEPERLRDVLLRSIQRRHGAGRHDHRPGEAALVLDSIDAPTVALDGTGRIIAVNGAWTAVSVRSGTSREATEIGVNYLAVCDRASGPLAEGAREAAGGIRAVLHGETDRFAMDYLCPQDGRDRWFSLRVTPSAPSAVGRW